ncbi:MAG: ATP-binding cassette domain-containing protein [Flavobacteriales bacterium]|nr:ATP-binding cassette domain-containing protein [Flavobacteriales bacterium]
MIKIENITKSYRKQVVLDAVDLQLQQGSCIALIGPNGSGKTTLIKSILGLVYPDNGSIRINNMDINSDASYRKSIGYMPQISRLPENMKVRQLFRMITLVREDIKPQQYDKELYQLFEIEKMEHKTLGSLSGGMRQKVSAALAFLFNPPVLILDEPTAALDPAANEYFRQKIYKAKNDNKLILITSHILSDLEGLVNQVVFMMDGKIRFHQPIVEISEETGESQLNKMIVSKLQENGLTWES